MCGITGIAGKEDKALLKRMTAKIKHRGPDEQGFFYGNKICMSNVRLSIIDLKTGKQPIYNEDKSLVIVYNGEIYNYKELRKDLEKKHKFSTKSDTEVIIHAYEEYGPECVKLFNGMFAFAIWDKKKNQLFLARDRLGIKPLYYYTDSSKLIFASEIKAILEDSTIKRKLNEEALIDYLTFQNILDNKTFFRGIDILRPGHYIIYKNKKLDVTKYWEASYKKKKQKPKEYIRDFQKVFHDSVKRHMISDVPVGSYLSGGIDSSSVATVASKLNNRLRTFTGRFDEKGYDESICSRVVAKKIDARPYTITMKPKDFLESIEKIVYHLDEPKLALNNFAQFHTAKLVSKHVKVVLTGHGGDELFAGYPVFKAIYHKNAMKRNPLNVPKALAAFKFSELPRSLYFLFFPLISPEVNSNLFIIFDQRERKKLFTKQFYNKVKNYRPLSVVNNMLKGKNLNNVDKAQYMYLSTYLSSLLVVEDKLGMAHSIESRTPILDNELVDFALSVPMKDKLYRNELKHIPKTAMKHELPEILYKQSKKGFPTPLSLWFRKELKPFVYETLLGERAVKRGIFNPKYVKRILDKHCSSKTDNTFDLVNANKIWSLILIELWFRIYID
ncbi:MAG: asparagine synthase (glutamine-hydrolyzing) [bacterium]|nr:asparagine synthase (glutamine-hydrolyzing) [bacterium]